MDASVADLDAAPRPTPGGPRGPGMVRDLDAALLRAADDLNAAGARWALFGVLAVPARSIRRSRQGPVLDWKAASHVQFVLCCAGIFLYQNITFRRNGCLFRYRKVFFVKHSLAESDKRSGKRLKGTPLTCPG